MVDILRLDFFEFMVRKYQGLNVPCKITQEFKTITDCTVTAITQEFKTITDCTVTAISYL